MVTPTVLPNVLRISFLVQDAPTKQSELVCFVRAMDTGKIELNYSHHVHHTRLVETGPWTETYRGRLPFSPVLESMMENQVALELLNHFLERTRVMPGEMMQELGEVEW